MDRGIILVVSQNQHKTFGRTGGRFRAGNRSCFLGACRRFWWDFSGTTARFAIGGLARYFLDRRRFTQKSRNLPAGGRGHGLDHHDAKLSWRLALEGGLLIVFAQLP